MFAVVAASVAAVVALRKESVDRNPKNTYDNRLLTRSLSARRAWIEIFEFRCSYLHSNSRSPQGERG